MLKKFKQAIFTISAAAALIFPVMTPVMVHAANETQIQDGVCVGTSLQISTTAPAGSCAGADIDLATTKTNALITKIINIFSSLVGIIAVIMIVFGGFKYITSGGNDSNIGAAKNTILYAVIGLVIVALAQIIVKYVLGQATKQ